MFAARILSRLIAVAMLAVAMVAFAIGSVAHAQAPVAAAAMPPQADTAAAIRQLSTDWSRAMLDRDAAILERIWSPDFVYVEPSGRRFTKAEGIADMKKSGERLTSAVADSIDVRTYAGGAVAVDIGTYTEAGKDAGGKPFERRTRFTNVWVRNGGAWQCVSGHASQLPAP